jgi:hypothetical protein
MSAAEPADLTPPIVNTTGGAAVIDITKKRGGTRSAFKGRWKMDSTDSGTTAGVTDPQRSIADSIEKTFNEYDLSLAIDDIATAYTVTLDWVGRALEGAQAQDIITAAQREKLAALVEGMKAAPGLV